MHPIPVVCDACRAEGLSGEDPFEAFGALLDFDPVPRRKARADGWDAETQRAFIAALSLTGSDRAAARAVGRAAFGATQLLHCEGSEGFAAAREEAMAIATSEHSRRLAEGLRAVASEQAGWRPPPAPWSRAASRRGRAGIDRAAPPTPIDHDAAASAERARLELIETLLQKYALKVREERAARLAGRVVAADFTLRQLTHIEVCADLLSGDGLRAFADFRHRGRDLVEIAETPLSRLLDTIRREQWEAGNAPPRPEHPPRRYLVEHDGFSTEPLEYFRGPDQKEQQRLFAERHKEDAKAQIDWEAKAAEAEHAERSDAGETSPPEQREEPSEAGRAAAQADSFDVTEFSSVTAPPPAKSPENQP